jgi:hypothetical protein
VLVVLASLYDIQARNLVSHWLDRNGEQDICLLTCKDLSIGGWHHYLNSDLNSTSVIGGKQIPIRNIKGVLTRLTHITDHELPHIISKDRPYVASEMMAFLVCWLSFLKCPILNRPTTSSCLCGPNWRHEQWVHAASKVGISVLRTERRKARKPPPSSTTYSDSNTQGDGDDVAANSNKLGDSNNNNHYRADNSSTIIIRNEPSAIITITVVGNRCLTDRAIENKDLVTKSLHLAHLARVDLLSVKYVQSSSPSGEYFFASADPRPCILPETRIERAVLDYFQVSKDDAPLR